MRAWASSGASATTPEDADRLASARAAVADELARPGSPRCRNDRARRPLRIGSVLPEQALATLDALLALHDTDAITWLAQHGATLRAAAGDAGERLAQQIEVVSTSKPRQTYAHCAAPERPDHQRKNNLPQRREGAKATLRNACISVTSRTDSTRSAWANTQKSQRYDLFAIFAALHSLRSA